MSKSRPTGAPNDERIENLISVFCAAVKRSDPDAVISRRFDERMTIDTNCDLTNVIREILSEIEK